MKMIWRFILVAVFCVGLTLPMAACNNQGEETKQEEVKSPPPEETGGKTMDEYVKEAKKEINEENVEEELKKLKEEIEAEMR